MEFWPFSHLAQASHHLQQGSTGNIVHQRINQNDVFKEHVVQYLVEEMRDMDIDFSIMLKSLLAQRRSCRTRSNYTRTRTSNVAPIENQRLENGRKKTIRWKPPSVNYIEYDKI